MASPIFSNKDLEEFRTIWFEEFDEPLSLDQALTEAEGLLDLVYQLRQIHHRSLRKQQNDKSG